MLAAVPDLRDKLRQAPPELADILAAFNVTVTYATAS
jgi:hypothetical protein